MTSGSHREKEPVALIVWQQRNYWLTEDVGRVNLNKGRVNDLSQLSEMEDEKKLLLCEMRKVSENKPWPKSHGYLF